MSGAPDVLGMLMERAASTLDGCGVRFCVQVTSPPRGPRPDGPLRVVRQVLDSEGVVHLIAAPTRGGHKIETS